MMEIVFTVNGLTVKARYDEWDVEYTFKPLVRRWQDLQKKKQRRIFVFLAAPPGCGKTILSLFLEHLSTQSNKEMIQAIGMDGFHYPNAYLESHTYLENGNAYPLKQRKGGSDTFDVEALKQKIIKGRTMDNLWPIYSRQIHDVMEDQIRLKQKIILIEGNYLLLNAGKWNSLITYCDDSVFVSAQEGELRQRLIERKIAGGSDPKEALDFYEQSDHRNVIQVLTQHHEANVELVMSDHRFMKKE